MVNLDKDKNQKFLLIDVGHIKKINNFKDSNALGDIIDNQIKKESEISRSYLKVKYALRSQKYDLAPLQLPT